MAMEDAWVLAEILRRFARPWPSRLRKKSVYWFQIWGMIDTA
jgi:hypothetical protein